MTYRTETQALLNVDHHVARRRPVGRGRVRRVALPGLAYFAAALIAAQAIFPIGWMVTNSLKADGEIYRNPWGLPAEALWSNYAAAWQTADVANRIGNSVYVTGLALLILVVCAVPAAYALERLRFPGGGLVYGLAVMSIAIPPAVMGIPLFVVARSLGLVNNLTGLAIVYAATSLPLAIVVLRSFVRSVPPELEEAARVDGAGTTKTFLRIIVPLIRPGVAFVLIISFLDIWNEFFLALLFLRSPELRTIPLGLAQFFQSEATQWPLYFAAQTIVTIPVLIAFVLLQRQFVAGLASGALKG